MQQMGKPKNWSRRNVAVQEMAFAKINEQYIFIHGAQEDRSVERRPCWNMWDTKE